MVFVFAICALLGALFFAPFLPTLIFIVLALYGVVKLLETSLFSTTPSRKDKRTKR